MLKGKSSQSVAPIALLKLYSENGTCGGVIHRPDAPFGYDAA